MKRFCSLFIWVCLGALLTPVSAQLAHRWDFQFLLGFSNYITTEIEPVLTYKLTPYLGVGMGVCVNWRSYSNPHIPEKSLDGRFEYSLDESELEWSLAFRPQLQFLTPEFDINHFQDMTFQFEISPGLTLASPRNRVAVECSPVVHSSVRQDVIYHYYENESNDWLFYHCRFALHGNVSDRFSLILGYQLSNYDPYNDTRGLYIDNEKVTIRDRSLYGCVYLGASYRF
ncbi:MAG TPA: hypothetical protein PLK40_03610 [Bacteroidaceae bacterium]|nr:hypothetical protein [Bacteroidaceae bacterium]